MLRHLLGYRSTSSTMQVAYKDGRACTDSSLSIYTSIQPLELNFYNDGMSL